jgi:hypothetical protein
MIRDLSPTALQPCHEVVSRSDLNCGVSSLHNALHSRSGGAYACVKKIAFAATTVFALWDRHAALGVSGCLVRGGNWTASRRRTCYESHTLNHPGAPPLHMLFTSRISSRLGYTDHLAAFTNSISGFPDLCPSRWLFLSQSVADKRWRAV